MNEYKQDLCSDYPGRIITSPLPVASPIGYSTFVRDEKSLFSCVDEGGFKIFFSYKQGLLFFRDSQRLCNKTINKLISQTIPA